jgi:hypothetical protein
LSLQFFLTAVVVSAAPLVASDANEVAAIAIVAAAAVVTAAAAALVTADGLATEITTEEFFLLLSSHAAYLFLSFSLRLSLGRRFLPRLPVVGAAEEEGGTAVDKCLPLQQNVSCSSPSHVSRVNLAHLLSCTHPLYSCKRWVNGLEGLYLLAVGELLVLFGSTPFPPATSAHEGAISGGENDVCTAPCSPSPH